MANRKLTEIYLGWRKIHLIIEVELDGVDWLYVFGLGYVSGFSEQRNQPSGFIECRIILD